jgi:hypothetical protein
MDDIPEGPFTWPMAREAGMARHRLNQLVRDRLVRKVFRNVYVRADDPDSLEQRARAARLVLGSHVVVRDRTAAWMWGVDTLEYGELEILPPLEASGLRGHPRPNHCGVAGGVRDLCDRDVIEVGNVRVTTPLRTALDLACCLSRRDALAALDAFMRLHGITREQMQRELVRYFRRRGVVQARQLVPLADPRSESSGESWTRMDMLDHGLPVPQLQWWVDVDGVPTYRLDLAYPKHRVAVEFDGREFHESPERRDADLRRRTWLRDHGWTVIVVTKNDFTAERVDAWISEIRDALRLAR